MKIIYLLSIISFLVIFSIGFLMPFKAAASHNTCRLKGGYDGVFVRVFDVDRDGNTIDGNFYKKYLLGVGQIWAGKLKNGQTKVIKSSNGKIRYDYKSSSAYRTYGNNTASCTHGETIRIP